MGNCKSSTTVNSSNIRQRYSVGRSIGRGSFGECKDCISYDSNEVFAVKIVKSSLQGGVWSPTAIFQREVQFLQSIQHKNIVRFIESFEDGEYSYIVTEKCSGGEVFEKVLQQKRLSQFEASRVCADVLRAIEYIHSIGIVHRDVKAENLLYAEDGSVKLVDFGLAAKLESDSQILTAVVGSAHYLAPEMIKQRYNKSVDIWSAGITLFLILYGRYPFDGECDEQIIRRIRRGVIDWTHDGLAVLTLQFLKLLLEREVSNRPTASECLRHPFLGQKQSDFDEITSSDSEVLVQEQLAVESALQPIDLNEMSGLGTMSCQSKKSARPHSPENRINYSTDNENRNPHFSKLLLSPNGPIQA